MAALEPPYMQPVRLSREDLSSVSPAQIELYLKSHGWAESEVFRGFHQSVFGIHWTHPTKENHRCLVLTTRDARDYVRRTAETMIDIGIVEDRLAHHVLAEIKRIDHDGAVSLWMHDMERRGIEIDKSEWMSKL